MTKDIVTHIYNFANSKSVIWNGDKEKYLYKELIETAQKIAFQLKKYEEKNVILRTKNDIFTLEAVLAIWQLNKVYIPVKIDAPVERVDLIKNQLEEFIEIEVLNDECILINNEKKMLDEIYSQIDTNPDSYAYVIFTSGTTGVPKGVPITHLNLEKLFENTEESYNFTSDDVWINLHSFEFDFSIWELFGALINGAGLVLPNDIKLYELDKIARLIQNKNVNILNQTPSAFYRLISYLNEKTEFKYIIFGGEKLNLSIIKDYYKDKKNTKFINMYGITEITVHATFHMLNDEDFQDLGVSNIGKAIGNSRVYLVDENRNEITEGIGEICVESASVSDGYLNNQELNAKVFSKRDNIKVYYSGDLGEYISNGDINYIGRRDKQIEKDGHRIELDEIKVKILENSYVKNCEMDFFNEKIICYYISSKNINDEIKKFLKNKLPDYMIPNEFVLVEDIPVNSNGKADLKTLRMSINISKQKSQTGKSESFREWLKNIISTKVNVITEKIKDDMTFFNLGLTSMQLIELHKNIIDNYECDKEFSVVDLFQYPNIEKLTQNFNMRRK